MPRSTFAAGHARTSHGLVVDVLVASATGQRETTLVMLHRHRQRGGARRWTVAADKAYDTADFIEGCRGLRVTPQVAQNINTLRGSRIDGRTVRHREFDIPAWPHPDTQNGPTVGTQIRTGSAGRTIAHHG